MHEIKSANFQRRELSDYARHAREFIGAGEKPFSLSVNYPANGCSAVGIDATGPRLPATGGDA